MISLREGNVFTSLNRDSADLFMEDKSALTQMSCADTQKHTFMCTQMHWL